MDEAAIELPVAPAELVRALPALMQRLAAIQFDRDGVALLDGVPIGGFRLVGGRHFTTGAQYALVVEQREPDGDVDHDALFVSIEQLDEEQFVVLAVKPEKHTANRQMRWVVKHPFETPPERIQYSGTKVDDERYPQTLHLDVHAPEFPTGTAPVALLDLRAMGVHVELRLALPSPRTLSYRGDYVDGAPTGLFAGMKRKMAEKVIAALVRAIVRSWQRGAQRSADPNDAEAVLWQMTIGQLARRPKKGVTRFIDETLAA